MGTRPALQLVKYSSATLLFLIMTVQLFAQDTSNIRRPWKGNAILGNGNICAVYSDDDRIKAISGSGGIQHFYFKDYTADYISSSSFKLSEEMDIPSFRTTQKPKENKTLGMEDFFTTLTRTSTSQGNTKKVRCFVHPRDAVILSLEVEGPAAQTSQQFDMQLRKRIVTDKTITLTSLVKEGNTAVASWNNGTVIAVAPGLSKYILEVNDSSITVFGRLRQKEKLEIITVAAQSRTEALQKIKDIKDEQDLHKTASSYWNKWMNGGSLPEFKQKNAENTRYLEFYKRNLYAAKSACLNGMIPADITGQFVTNNMPQLYPRDAMMVARVFLMTGHTDEAKSVISFWTNPSVPEKSRGEFYARYDAHAKAVDAGSGARYDEPEWDANGYYIQLVKSYHDLKKEWLCDKSFIYLLADFLVEHIDKTGLLYEGGIVEWTGYLPSTNMTCSAALSTASGIAKEMGDNDKSLAYKKASETIAMSLTRTLDKKRNILADVRFHGVKEGNASLTGATNDTLFLWDTSLNFGVIWGFPNTKELKITNEFIQKNNVKMNGGVQYFEAADNGGLSSYGGDLFFFTTPASAQYQLKYGDRQLAKKHIDWMVQNSNVYGLMPERIYLNETDCSPASPLSWCCAEFAAAVLILSGK
ncbi:MAG: hypothetical protein ACM3S2_19750 [Ignavibacteriales bacterium]